MKKKKKYLLVSLCILSLMSIIITILPVIIAHQLVNQLEYHFNRPVSVDDVDLNLFTLEFRLEKFEIQELSSKNSFVSFDAFYLDASWRSLFKQCITIETIQLHKPHFNVAMKSDATFNFSDLIPEPHRLTETSKPPEKKSDTKVFHLDQLPVHFDIQNVSIHNGHIAFKDHKHGLTHNLNHLNVDISQLTNAPTTTNQPTDITLNFILNNCNVQTHTQANLFDKTPSATMHIFNDGGNFSFYQPYLNKFLDWKIVSGELKTDLKVNVTLKNNTPDLSFLGNIKIVDFELIESEQNKLMSFPLFEFQFNTSRPIKSQINLALVKLIQPEINIIRRKDQSINLIPVLKNASIDKNIRKNEDAKISHVKKTANNSLSKSTHTLDLNIQKVMIDSGQIDVKDFSTTDPFSTQFKQLKLILEGVHLKDQKILSMDFYTEIFPHGKISINGALQLSPQKFDGHLFVENFDISMFHPYLQKFLNGHLESGRLFIQSDTHFEQKKNTPHMQFSGNLALKNFIYKEPAQAKDVLSWDNLEIKKINSGLFPHYLDIDAILLDHLIAPICLLKDGKLNWIAILKETAQKTSEKKALPENSKTAQKEKTSIIGDSKLETAHKEDSKETRAEHTKNISKATTTDNKKKPLFQRLNIRKVVLENSNIRFVDKTMKPSFFANMTELNGQILGFDQHSGQSAKFVLNGKFNDLSPLQIVGEIAPFQDSLTLKAEILFQGIEVPLFTTYTRHYIGYPLNKGQLTLNLDYLVEKNQLTSKNNIVIDQLELGEQAENAEINALPLKFALALLKDRNGKIQMNIPVTGNLDALNFSLKEVILNALKNVLEKIVTSPFSFLAGVFGGKEDIQSLTFNYGKTTLNQSTNEKIKQLGHLLSDRPLLKLQLQSSLNTPQEISALKRIRLHKEMALIKFKEQAIISNNKNDPKDVMIKEKDYYQYLVKLYLFRNKKLPDPKYENRRSLESKLLSTIDINQEDLDALSLKRMVQVRNVLIDKYQIASDRIFLGDRNVQSDHISKNSASQIILKLK